MKIVALLTGRGNKHWKTKMYYRYWASPYFIILLWLLAVASWLSFRNDPFLSANFYYKEETDGMYCPMGQRMKRLLDMKRTTPAVGSHSRICLAVPEHGVHLCPLCHRCRGGMALGIAALCHAEPCESERLMAIRNSFLCMSASRGYATNGLLPLT